MARLSVPNDPEALKGIIEAMIFASEEPLPPRTLIRLLFEEDEKKNGNASTGTSLFDLAEQGALLDEQMEEESAEGDAPPAEESRSEQADSAGEELVEADEIEVGADAESTSTESQDEWDAAEGEVAEGAEEEGAGEDHLPEGEVLEVDEETIDQIRMGGKFGQKELRQIIALLNDDYETEGRSFRIIEIAGGFQFATIRDYGEYVGLLSKERSRRKLSPASLETLAIVAYRQPVTKPEVEAIRGVNCDQVLLSLLERNLIVIAGRGDSVGRPLLYGTSDEFLRAFGLNGLGDLPKLRELEELMEEDAHDPTRPDSIPAEVTQELLELDAEGNPVIPEAADPPVTQENEGTSDDVSDDEENEEEHSADEESGEPDLSPAEAPEESVEDREDGSPEGNGSTDVEFMEESIDEAEGEGEEDHDDNGAAEEEGSDAPDFDEDEVEGDIIEDVVEEENDEQGNDDQKNDHQMIEGERDLRDQNAVAQVGNDDGEPRAE